MELPSEDTLRSLVAAYARLRAAHGEAIGEPQLVEPTGRFFPDEFKVDAPSVERLLERMMSYAPIAQDLDVELAYLEPEGGGGGGGGCGSGGCATGEGKGASKPRDGVMETESGYRVFVSVSDVGHPVTLTTSLARSVGALVLLEADEETGPIESEIAATFVGLGPLLLAGAAVYTKACGGLRMHRATHLAVEELAVLVALFVRVHEKKPAGVRAHLEATQLEAFDEALRWVDSNASLVSRLRAHPETLEDGVFDVAPVRGLLGRILGRRRARDDEHALVAPASSKRPERTEAERKRIAETRALVEEALAED